MKKTYVFARDLTVDVPAQGDGGHSRAFRAGDTIGQGDILSGCFESLVRVGDLVELPPEPTAEPAATEPPPAAPAKASKSK